MLALGDLKCYFSSTLLFYKYMNWVSGDVKWLAQKSPVICSNEGGPTDFQLTVGLFFGVYLGGEVAIFQEIFHIKHP